MFPGGFNGLLAVGNQLNFASGFFQYGLGDHLVRLAVFNNQDPCINQQLVRDEVLHLLGLCCRLERNCKPKQASGIGSRFVVNYSLHHLNQSLRYGQAQARSFVSSRQRIVCL